MANPSKCFMLFSVPFPSTWVFSVSCGKFSSDAGVFSEAALCEYSVCLPGLSGDVNAVSKNITGFNKRLCRMNTLLDLFNSQLRWTSPRQPNRIFRPPWFSQTHDYRHLLVLLFLQRSADPGATQGVPAGPSRSRVRGARRSKTSGSGLRPTTGELAHWTLFFGRLTCFFFSSLGLFKSIFSSH